MKSLLNEEVAKVEQTPLHDLDSTLQTSLKRVLAIAGEDNSILHEGNLVGRFEFAGEAVEKLNVLKTFTRSCWTRQFISNNSDHRVF